MVGEDEEDKDEDDSELHDTMAEPLLTASQIIQHDSQYAGMMIVQSPNISQFQLVSTSLSFN